MPKTTRVQKQKKQPDPSERIEHDAERRAEAQEARLLNAEAVCSCSLPRWEHTREEQRACDLRELGANPPTPAPLDAEPEDRAQEAPTP